MLFIKDLNVTFNRTTNLEREIISSLDLNIQRSEFLTIIGSNGAGKSTILNVIAGNIMPTKGNIYLEDKDITTTPNYDRAEFIAKVIQDPAKGTLADMTIEENLAFASMRGKKRGFNLALSKNKRDFFAEKLRILDMKLEDRMKDKVSSLSGGQRQALSLIMATLMPAKILLLDEHTAALDPKTAAKIIEITDQIIKDSDLTVLMVTHNMNHALHYGSRTILMHEGKILRDLSSQDKQSMKPSDLAELFGEI